MIRPPKRAMSPSESSQPRGTSSQAFIAHYPPRRPGPSSDRLQFRIGGQQRLGEDVVEGEEREERDHDRLVHRPPYPGSPARGSHAFVTTDDRDDRAEERALHHRAPEVGDRVKRKERREEAEEALVVEDLG